MTGGRRLKFPVGRQKGLEIRLGNPHQSVDAVSDEPAIFYPAPDGSRRGAVIVNTGDYEQLLPKPASNGSR